MLLERNTCVVLRGVVRVVVRTFVEAQCTPRFFGVELAKVALSVSAVEVMDTIGHITRLLNFDDEIVGANAMYLSGGDEERIAGTCFVARK